VEVVIGKLYFLIKIFITVIIIVVASEIAKLPSFLAGLIVSIPLTTFLAII